MLTPRRTDRETRIDFSPRLGLPYLLPNQAQKHVTLNEALRRLDITVQASALSAALVSPPADPEEGNCYLIADGTPAGGWAGQAPGDLAAWQDGAWVFITPQPGCTCLVRDTDAFLYFGTSGWTPAAPAAQPEMLGIIAAPDTTNRLTVKADAELLSHDDIMPGSGNARKVINKATPGDTASVVFQMGFSGRAEFGLAGDDDFNVKVTADGTSWREAFFVAGASGFTGFGTGAPSAPITIDTRAFETLDAGGAGRRKRPVPRCTMTGCSLCLGQAMTAQAWSFLWLSRSTCVPTATGRPAIMAPS